MTEAEHQAREDALAKAAIEAMFAAVCKHQAVQQDEVECESEGGEL
jgi:hypothetical protein